MMTALFLESGKDMNAEITIPASLTQEFKDIQNANGSTINLRIGETVRRIDLLYGLLVASANDAASAIASDVSDGDLTAFVARMNQYLKSWAAPAPALPVCTACMITATSPRPTIWP